MDEFEDIPVEPGEASNLGLHVTNCIKRHTSLVRLIRRQEIRRAKLEVAAWVYRMAVMVMAAYITHVAWAASH